MIGAIVGSVLASLALSVVVVRMASSRGVPAAEELELMALNAASRCFTWARHQLDAVAWLVFSRRMHLNARSIARSIARDRDVFVRAQRLGFARGAGGSWYFDKTETVYHQPDEDDYGWAFAPPEWEAERAWRERKVYVREVDALRAACDYIQRRARAGGHHA